LVDDAEDGIDEATEFEGVFARELFGEGVVSFVAEGEHDSFADAMDSFLFALIFTDLQDGSCWVGVECFADKVLGVQVSDRGLVLESVIEHRCRFTQDPVEVVFCLEEILTARVELGVLYEAFNGCGRDGICGFWFRCPLRHLWAGPRRSRGRGDAPYLLSDVH